MYVSYSHAERECMSVSVCLFTYGHNTGLGVETMVTARLSPMASLKLPLPISFIIWQEHIASVYVNKSNKALLVFVIRHLYHRCSIPLTAIILY